VSVQDPIPEQYGWHILMVGRSYYLQAGGHLRPLLLYMALLVTHDLLPEDLSDGLRWLVEHGYLEPCGSFQSGYTLTPKGAAAL
jgi:hypothetical protein